MLFILSPQSNGILYFSPLISHYKIPLLCGERMKSVFEAVQYSISLERINLEKMKLAYTT